MQIVVWSEVVCKLNLYLGMSSWIISLHVLKALEFSLHFEFEASSRSLHILYGCCFIKTAKTSSSGVFELPDLGLFLPGSSVRDLEVQKREALAKDPRGFDMFLNGYAVCFSLRFSIFEWYSRL